MARGPHVGPDETFYCFQADLDRPCLQMILSTTEELTQMVIYRGKLLQPQIVFIYDLFWKPFFGNVSS